MDTKDKNKAEILAPAGNRASFLAAIAAGADAVYCGLKSFSARMEADNFSMDELASLTRLARENGVKVYVTLNSLIKPSEISKAASQLDKLERFVKPDAVIVSDPAFVRLKKETGFKGEIHLSTLANMSFAGGIETAGKLGINRVVLPRELNIEEIRAMAKACPPSVDLEVFIHGALCYGISGRCYWSSFFGGKSGLRGRCVQPCRRVYDQKGSKKRFFSCQDLGLDVLVKVLLEIPEIKTWKIEGRKKGPHYVYYTVTAYKMLRDHGRDPKMKKAAVALLERALGRPTTHYGFLPQRPQNPVDTENSTGSGLFLGKTQGAAHSPYFVPREALMAGDLLRIGYEDKPGHAIQRVYKSVPKKGRLHLKFKGSAPPKGSPVFLIDRREKELEQMIGELEKKLAHFGPVTITPADLRLKMPRKGKNPTGAKKYHPLEMVVSRKPGKRSSRGESALWLSPAALKSVSGKALSKQWWWLPPVIWPNNEQKAAELLKTALRGGARRFVLNAPWQLALFPHTEKRGSKGLELWAGPFCNLANGMTADLLKSLGFSGIIASPELSGEDYRQLPGQSPIPVGAVVSGSWPLVISRTLAENIKTGQVFTSPKGENAWARYTDNNYWIYPDWQLDISAKKEELKKAGYTLFVHMDEAVPSHIKLRKRPGMWNWDLRLL